MRATLAAILIGVAGIACTTGPEPAPSTPLPRSSPPQASPQPPPAAPEPPAARVEPLPTLPAVSSLPPLPPVAFRPPRPIETVRAVYEFAALHPEVLRYVPCFCGCERDGHRDNEDCFVASRGSDGRVTWDAHGIG